MRWTSLRWFRLFIASWMAHRKKGSEEIPLLNAILKKTRLEVVCELRSRVWSRSMIGATRPTCH
ncbi:hypothetical protein KOSB73_320041 [Klebsiella grimontii]|uniref:Uncharacterized protein n=1 Tax=Klebsiella grimontii TaxID=2058152 RepID=A0A285B8X1_9ENTR|nr:hypothetical protein KOSB73_320041 [Klebsiella grimontii]